MGEAGRYLSSTRDHFNEIIIFTFLAILICRYLSESETIFNKLTKVCLNVTEMSLPFRIGNHFQPTSEEQSGYQSSLFVVTFPNRKSFCTHGQGFGIAYLTSRYSSESEVILHMANQVSDKILLQSRYSSESEVILHKKREERKRDEHCRYSSDSEVILHVSGPEFPASILCRYSSESEVILHKGDEK